MRKPLHLELLLLLAFGLSGPQASAKEAAGQARFFAGLATVSPTSFNDEMRAQGLKELNRAASFGVEATLPVLQLVELGISYIRRPIYLDEVNSDPLSEYNASVDQDAVSAVLRIPFLKSSFFRADVFGSIGIANSKISLKTASQDGSLSKKAQDDWSASSVSRYGASVGVGFRSVYLYAEYGVEINRVDSFVRSGNISDNIKALDLSGPYGAIGLMFDGAAISRQ